MASLIKRDLAIIILDWNGAEDTIDCLKTLNNFDLYDIYLLDNGSLSENVKKVSDYLCKQFKKDFTRTINIGEPLIENLTSFTYILSDNNLGFAAGNNYVAKRICGYYKYILLLNNDTEVPPRAIEHMLKTSIEKGTVALTCDIRKYYQKDELWNAGGYFTIFGDRKYYSQKKIDQLEAKGTSFIKAEFITGCAIIVNSKYIKDNGLFTEDFFHGEEDFNFCYKLKKNNVLVGVDLAVRLYHKVGRSIERAGNDDREYCRMLVHYSNRVIDFKSLYPFSKWKVWRALYLFLIVIKRIASGTPFDKAFLLGKRIRKISNENTSVSKSLFDTIIQMKWN